MRRRVVWIAGCLAAGAVVNVLVAWACVWLELPRPTSWYEHYAGDEAAERGWPVPVPARWGLPTHHVTFWHTVGVTQICGASFRRLARRTLSGLPMRSMMMTERQDMGPVSPVEHAWCIPVRGRSGWPRGLPLMPVWPGFAANTAFYAIVLWAVIAGSRSLRRMRRRRGGLCATCAYDLAGLATCPECGTARSSPGHPACQRHRRADVVGTGYADPP